jgi:hypothetical protein
LTAHLFGRNSANMSIFKFLPVLVYLVSAPAMAAAPYTPKPGSAERMAIMQAIRDGIGSDTVFVVDFLKVAGTSEGGLAYAEVHPVKELGFLGWAFLRKSGGQWHFDSAIGSDGANDCAEIAEVYRHPLDLATQAKVAPELLFSPSFYADYAEAEEGAKEDVSCVGDIATSAGQ